MILKMQEIIKDIFVIFYSKKDKVVYDIAQCYILAELLLFCVQMFTIESYRI